MKDRDRWYGAISIEELSDFLEDHTMVFYQPGARLAEHARRWSQLLASFWLRDIPRPDDVSYVLWYHAPPRAGRVDVSLLVASSDKETTRRIAQRVLYRLRSFRIGEFRWEADRADAFRSIAHDHIFEIRQSDRLAKTMMGRYASHHSLRYVGTEAETYLVAPWWGPGGPFLNPIAALMDHQAHDVSLFSVLSPTSLSREEISYLATMAMRGASAATAPRSVDSTRKLFDHQADPVSSLIGRLYSSLLRRLDQPFLCAAYVSSSDRDAAEDVAMVLASMINGELPFEIPLGMDTPMESRASVLDLAEVCEEAQAALRRLQLYHSPSAALESIEKPAEEEMRAAARLRYLTDARGAATVVRLPVSVRGGVPGIVVRQQTPEFVPGAVLDRVSQQEVRLGRLSCGGWIAVPLGDLAKHVLVTGFTGSGKTVTVLQILHQLWIDHACPFLVLESAKTEYRGLLGVDGFEKLQVYTLGNERGVPFRLNPFELLPGMRVEAHISRLQSCFEAAIPPIGPSSSVIAEALIRSYNDCGWLLTDIYPTGQTARRQFPTLSGFVEWVARILKERDYRGEVLHNLQAALVGRFRPLLIGSKGRMFDTQRSSPSFDNLFGLPTVLEMNDLNLEDKALVVMFVLTFLREYREFQSERRERLAHLTVVEEAHNVLEEVSSHGSGEGVTAADTRYRAVQAFCSLLTEIRAFGEGLIIADQSPQKLARDAIRNTNLQIAHQLRDDDDRLAIARAMILEPEQRLFLGKLRPGQAAVFHTKLDRATIIQVPKYSPDRSDVEALKDDDKAEERLRRRFPGFGFAPLTTDQVREKMRGSPAGTNICDTVEVPFGHCKFCRDQCQHRDAVFGRRIGNEDRRLYLGLLGRPIPGDENQNMLPQVAMDRAAQHYTSEATELNLPRRASASWCVFAHAWDQCCRETAERDRYDPRRHILDDQTCQRLFRHMADRFENVASAHEEAAHGD